MKSSFYVINMSRTKKRRNPSRKKRRKVPKNSYNRYVQNLSNLRGKYKPKIATVSIISEKSRSGSRAGSRPRSSNVTGLSGYRKEPKVSQIVNICNDEVIDLRGLGENEIFNSFNKTHLSKSKMGETGSSIDKFAQSTQSRFRMHSPEKQAQQRKISEFKSKKKRPKSVYLDGESDSKDSEALRLSN